MIIKAKVILALFYQKSYPLSRGRNALDDPKNSKIFCINLENFVVLTRSAYVKNGLRYRQSYYIPCLVISHDQNFFWIRNLFNNSVKFHQPK